MGLLICFLTLSGLPLLPTYFFFRFQFILSYIFFSCFSFINNASSNDVPFGKYSYIKFEVFNIAPELFLFFWVVLGFIFFSYRLKKGLYSSPRELFFNVVFITFFLFFYLIFYVKIFFYYNIGYFFANFYITRKYIVCFKIFVLFFGCFFFLILLSIYFYERFFVWEFPILVAGAVLGNFLVFSSNHFFVMLIGFEIQSLILYIMAGLKKDSNLAKESSLRSYILGSFYSCIFLLGVTFIFLATGSLGFDEIRFFLIGFNYSLNNMRSVIFLVGLFFVFYSLFFKLAVFPFSFWISEVYSGLPKIILLFFLTIAKISPIFVLIKFSYFFSSFFPFISFLFLFLGFLTVSYGIISSLYAFTLKKFLTLTGITHIGFILLMISKISLVGTSFVLFYFFIYLVNIFGIFLIVLGFRDSETYRTITNLSDIVLFFRSSFFLGLCFSVFVLSLAGMPPFSGFFGKFYFVSFLISSGDYFSSVFIVFSSVFSFVYYLRLIRFLYFNEHVNVKPHVVQMPFLNSFFISIILFFNIFFYFFHANLLVYFVSFFEFYD